MPTNLPLLSVLACLNAETRASRGGPATLTASGHRAVRRLPRLRLADLTSRHQPNDTIQTQPTNLLGLTARAVVGVPYCADVPVPFDLVSMGLVACDMSGIPPAVVPELTADTLPGFIGWATSQLPWSMDRHGLLLFSSDTDSNTKLRGVLDLFDPQTDWWSSTFRDTLGPILTETCRAVRRARLLQDTGTPAEELGGLLDAPMPDKCVVWLHRGVTGPVPRRTAPRHQPGRADAVAIVVNNNATHPYDVLDIEASVTLTGETLMRNEWDALAWSFDVMNDPKRAALGQPVLTAEEWEVADMAYQAYKTCAAAHVRRRQQMCRDVLTRLQHWLDGRGHHPQPGTPEHDELTTRLRFNAVQRGYSPEDAATFGADDLTPVGRPRVDKAATQPTARVSVLEARLAAVLAAIRLDLDPMDADHPARPILEGYVAAAEGEK